ncbi:hypothetical protein OAI26_03655 [Sulfitobacter sp.]|nr:hypothetical protein [Sulfitobacter sp.]
MARKKTIGQIEASKPFKVYSGRNGAYDFGGGGVGRAELKKPSWSTSTVRSGSKSSTTYKGKKKQTTKKK